MEFGFVKGDDDMEKKIPKKIIASYDGYNSYLIIVDKKTRYMFVFLSKSKQPPVQTVDTFLKKHGISKELSTGLNLVIRTDKGGELYVIQKFKEMASKNGYTIEPTAAGSSSQNGIAERLNRTIVETLRAMLMGAGLSATY